MGRKNEYHDVFKHIDLKPVWPMTCWLWVASVSDKGMPYFQVEKRKYVAYRLVYWLTHPTWDILNRREMILHTCVDANGVSVDNPLCCNPDHLRPGTHEQNMLDMMLRSRKGLTKSAIFDIVKIHKDNPELTHSQIAARVSFANEIPVARQTVTDILSGRRRKVLRDVIDIENKAIDESGNT